MIRSADKYKWDVTFDFDGKLKKGTSSRSLIITSNGECVPLARDNLDDSTNGSGNREVEVRI